MAPDELTGLLTRAEILDKLQSELRKNQPLTVAYLDCRHLLGINNQYGHLAGDDFIRLVGEVLAEATRGAGITGRIAGDEFLLIVAGQPLEQALALAEKARLGVEQRPLEIHHNGQPLKLPVSISVGAAYFPDDGVSLSADELVRRAYDAMLRGKETGGNAVCLYSEVEERDPLTGTLKREGILAQFEKARERADQAHTSTSIINLDIDEFDAINKQYGRYTGDEVLRRVAHVLASNFKELGFVGRYAGDEFVIVLPESRAESAFVLAEEVRRAIEDTRMEVAVGEQKTHVSLRVSGGVAEYPSDGSDWESLFRRSDEALFRAKRQGRNRICLPVSSQMVTKTSHYTQTQLEKLADLAKKTGKTEAHLLREGLDDLLKKYDQ
jgi:diguanylate cyclase